ncbi:MAG: DUF512 domain-containing protein [Cyanobacteriota bacterium]
MNNFYKAKILDVSPGSIAAKHSVEPGDCLLSIDNKPLKDLLDYQFAIYDTEIIKLNIQKKDDSKQIINIVKKPDEDLGITFESGVFDGVRICNNRCIFCFVDQQPSGLRESLYVKDDDYRLSYLQGTYVTLTNLTESDKKRIEQLKIGPLFISVHTTNPELRIKMLNNPKAGDIVEKLKWLEKLFIPVNAQIVVCPGYNDSDELVKTLYDLADLDNVLSVAVVPLGLTIYRKDNLLTPFNTEIAIETLKIIEEVNNYKGNTFVVPADEILILARNEIPQNYYYNDYDQLEDGVGVSRLVLDQFESMELPKKIVQNKHIGVITAALAADVLEPAFSKLAQIENLNFQVIKIENKFWGTTVTVCGLIVGQDIIDKLDTIEKLPDELFIPSIMLRKFSDEFIDGIKLSDIENKFNIKINIIKNPYSFEELIEFIKKLNANQKSLQVT